METKRADKYVGHRFYKVNGTTVVTGYQNGNIPVYDLKFVVNEYVCVGVTLWEESIVERLTANRLTTRNPVLLNMEQKCGLAMCETTTVSEDAIDIFPSMSEVWVSSEDTTTIGKAMDAIRQSYLNLFEKGVCRAESELSKARAELEAMKILVEQSRKCQRVSWLHHLE